MVTMYRITKDVAYSETLMDAILYVVREDADEGEGQSVRIGFSNGESEGEYLYSDLTAFARNRFFGE
jgi:hypothetical protein